MGNSKQVIAWRQRKKYELIVYKGGKCFRCGYDKTWFFEAFVFHHVDGKTFQIGGSTKGIDELKREVDKCELLCVRCHAEVHGNKHLNLRIKVVEEFYEIKNFSKEAVCLYCTNTFIKNDIGQKYCSHECSSKHHAKVQNRPSKEELIELLNSHNYCAVGRLYKVSDNAVRKWARKYSILK
jgi:hypothetical protein